MDGTTQQFLDAYRQTLEPEPFLLTLFQSPTKNFHDRDTVGVDVVRAEPRVAIPLPAGNTGTRKVELTKYTNQEWTPPVYDTEVSIHAYNATTRRPGFNPYEPDAPMLKAMVDEAGMAVEYVYGMTARGGELQAASILLTGANAIIDESGGTMFTASFNAKGTHFVTPATAWGADGATGTPETDVDGVASVVLRDSKRRADQLIGSPESVRRLLANAKIRDNLNKLHMNYGDVNRPQSRNGARYYGNITIVGQDYDLWSYDGFYIHPQTGVATTYIPNNKLIVRATTGRLDATYGSISRVAPPEARAMQFMPSRLSLPGRNFDVSTYSWITPNGKSLQLTVGTRMLLLATDVDSFGCLTVF